MEQIIIIPVQKTNEDGQLIMKWRNDELTRKNSFNQNIKVWINDDCDKSFKQEFFNNYFKNIPLFAVLNDVKIGFVSFCNNYNNNNNDYNIGINLNPDFRGKGLSKLIIKQSVEYVKKYCSNIKNIYAEIKEFNIPSIKGFTRAGFKFVTNEKRIINDKEESINIYLID